MLESYEFYDFLHDVLFTSIFGIIGLNSLFLYLVIGNRVFSHYGILLFGLTAHTSLPFFFETYPVFTGMISIITAMITVLGSLLFTRSFIGFDIVTHRFWTKYYAVMISIVLFIIGVQLLNLTIIRSESFSDTLSYLAALVTLINILSNFMVSASMWNSHRAARLYLFINAPMIIAGCAYTIMWFAQIQGAMGSSPFIRFVISGSMAIQMVLFSVFVGYRIKNAEKEKLEMEQDINRKLSEEIQQQTRAMAIAKEEVESQRNRLSQLNDLKNKLFTLIAHDLRNPLNHLSSLIEMIESQTVSSETKISISKQTKMEVSESITVIERLLQWTYKQLDGIHVQSELLSLKEINQEVITELKSVKEDKHVEIQMDLNVDTIQFDRDMLRVVTRNLLSNAIKFSFEEGEIIISSWSDNEKVYVSFRDHGIGMDPEWFKNLIARGKPAVKKGTKGEKGTGFGLLISKDFVEMNGGRLKCESEKGKGTVFTLEVPYA